MKAKSWNKLTNSPKINKKAHEDNLGKNLLKDDYDMKYNQTLYSAIQYNQELSNSRKYHKSVFLKSKIRRAIERENLANTKDFFNIQLMPNVSMFNPPQQNPPSFQVNNK